MSNDDYDRVFGGRTHQNLSFADRFARPTPPPSAPSPAPAPTPAVDPKESLAGSGDYKPYGYLPTANVGETCDVQRWLDGTEIAEGIEFQYRFLMQIGYVGEEQIKLFLPDCIVVIEGRNLRDLRKKLARRQVTFIQQYNPRVWPPIVERDEAVVERIILLRGGAVANSD